MKRVVFIFLALFPLIFTGCIVSSTPKESSVAVWYGDQQAFQITVFPKSASTVWKLDGTICSTGSTEFIYAPQIGTSTSHTLEVEEKSFLGTHKHTWTLTDQATPAASIERKKALINASEGGTITVSEEESLYSSRLEVIIPPDALSQDTEITIGDLVAAIPQAPADYVHGGLPIELKPDGLTFNKPVTLKIPFKDDEMFYAGATDPNSVMIAYYDQTTMRWESVDIVSIDTQNKYIIVNTTHFSLWQKFWPFGNNKKDPKPVTHDDIRNYVQNTWGVVGNIDDINALINDQSLDVPYAGLIGGLLTWESMWDSIGNKDYSRAINEGLVFTGEFILSETGYLFASSIVGLSSLSYKLMDSYANMLDDSAFNVQTSFYVQWRTQGVTREELAKKGGDFTDDNGWVLNPSGSYSWHPAFNTKLQPEVIWAEGEYLFQMGKAKERTVEESNTLKNSFINDLAEIVAQKNPVATFTISPSRYGNPPYSVTLDPSGSSAKENATITQYRWKINSEVIIKNSPEVISRTFDKPGDYPVCLDVTDSNGRISYACDIISVANKNPNDQPPTADFTYTLTDQNYLTLKVDASPSHDPDGSIISYEWSLGDGHIKRGMQVDETYDAPGWYTIELRVTDNNLITTRLSKKILLGNASPIAEAGPNQSVQPGVTVTLDGSGSSDPDNNIVSYHWQQTGGPTITLSDPNVVNPQFVAPGLPSGAVLVFKLLVTDAGGFQSTDTCLVTVQPSGPIITFQGMYGGSGGDSGWPSIMQTKDGGYIVVSSSESVDIQGVTNHGSTDMYIVKLDAYGDVVWQKMYGGLADDYPLSVQQDTDGDYMVAGFSRSSDIVGVTNHGWYDYYVLKLDTNGEIIWQKMYGGSGDDRATSIKQTIDGGYIVVGVAQSNIIPGVIYHGGYSDVYVIKLSKNGDVVWQKTYGGNYDDIANDIQLTSDGSYIIAGESSSTDIPGTVNHGGAYDSYILKINSDGDVIWQQLYGTIEDDRAFSICLTTGGGYMFTGWQTPNDIPVTRLDANGGLIWRKMYGGSEPELSWHITQASDGGYIIAGESYSTDIVGTINHGTWDAYLFEVDINGEVAWQRLYGGSSVDKAYDIKQTFDGGYIIAGGSSSTDIPGVINSGSNDLYIIKINSDGNF